MLNVKLNNLLRNSALCFLQSANYIFYILYFNLLALSFMLAELITEIVSSDLLIQQKLNGRVIENDCYKE